MKHLLLTTIVAVVLVGCGESQELAPAPEAKPVEPVAETTQPEPQTAKVPDISIHEAVKARNIEAVKQHLEAGADVNAESRGGLTPLFLATIRGHKEIAELLIAKGADVNAACESGLFKGETPLDWAIQNTKPEIADLLRKHGGKSGAKDSIFAAARLGNIESVKQHLAAGTDVNAKGNKERTPLHEAAWEGQKEICELLIANGADVNAKDKDGITPLELANIGGKNEVANLLRAHIGNKSKKTQYTKPSKMAIYKPSNNS